MELVADLLDDVDADRRSAERCARCWPPRGVHSPLFTLRGGTNEVLRGVVAQGWGCDDGTAGGVSRQPTR